MSEYFTGPGQKENPVVHYSGTLVTSIPVSIAREPYTLTDEDIAKIKQYSAERKAAEPRIQIESTESNGNKPFHPVEIVSFPVDQKSK